MKNVYYVFINKLYKLHVCVKVMSDEDSRDEAVLLVGAAALLLWRNT